MSDTLTPDQIKDEIVRQLDDEIGQGFNHARLVNDLDALIKARIAEMAQPRPFRFR